MPVDVLTELHFAVSEGGAYAEFNASGQPYKTSDTGRSLTVRIYVCVLIKSGSIR